MYTSPRLAPPPLPTDPEARAYVVWSRLCAEFTRAIQRLSDSDFLFLVAGKPFEPVIPDSASALEVAVLKQESRGGIGGYAQANGIELAGGLSNEDAFELCLTDLVQRNPRAIWRTIIEFLKSDPVPYPASGLDFERDISDEEQLLHEIMLDADLTQFTGKKVNSTIGFRHHLQDEGVDVEALLAAQKQGRLTAIDRTSENLALMQDRANYYRTTAQEIANEILLLAPQADLEWEVDYQRCISAHDGYAKAINELDTSDALSLLGTENPGDSNADASEPVEPSEGVLSPNSKDLPTSPAITAQMLSEALQMAPERLAGAVEERKEYLTPADVAGMLDMPLATVWQRLREGVFPSKRLGNRYLISREKLEESLKDPTPVKQRNETVDGGEWVDGSYRAPFSPGW